MSVYNFFRDLFGLRRNDQQETPNNGLEDQRQYRDDFRNPIWQTGEDDDEDCDDFRQPGHGDFGFGHFSVHSDPFDMARYFETQMDGMLRNFFGFSHGDMVSPFGGETEDDGFESSLPDVEPPRKRENLRDEVLKPGYENPPPKSFGAPEKEKVDHDLDGKITSDELSKVWREPGTLFRETDSHFGSNGRRTPFFFHSFGRSISTKIIRKPDGTVERHKTVRDSEGNVETTITQQIGDKSRTVVIKKDKNGRETETETETDTVDSIGPMNPGPFFGIADGDREDRRNPLQDFPWQKFFGPHPKL